MVARDDAASMWTAETCPSGKRTYVSKAAARKARARHPRGSDGRRLSVYVCTLCAGVHLGHLPGPVIRGELGREDILPHRPRDVS